MWRLTSSCKGYGPPTNVQNQRHAGAKHCKRADRALRKLKTYLGRVTLTPDP
ncbi:MAG TPA: hypothetical protein VHT52_11070 [Stellaceae bacterium]|nr:hypothetical protein [Stellaceae bacterium]